MFDMNPINLINLINPINSLKNLGQYAKAHAEVLLAWQTPLYIQAIEAPYLQVTSEKNVQFKHDAPHFQACYNALIDTLLNISWGVTPLSELSLTLNAYQRTLPPVSYIKLADCIHQAVRNLTTSGYRIEECISEKDTVFQLRLNQLKDQLNKTLQAIADTQHINYRDTTLVIKENTNNNSVIPSSIQQTWMHIKNAAGEIGFQIPNRMEGVDVDASTLAKGVVVSSIVAITAIKLRPLVVPITVATFNQYIAPAAAVLPTLNNPIQTRYVDVGQEFKKIIDLNDAFSDPDEVITLGGVNLQGGGPIPPWLNFQPQEVAGRRYVNNAQASKLYNNHLFVANGSGNCAMSIFDVSNAPKKFVSCYKFSVNGASVKSIDVFEDIAYLGYNGGVELVNVSQVTLPAFMASYPPPGGLTNVKVLKAKQDKLYMLLASTKGGIFGEQGKLQLANTTNKMNITFTSEFISENATFSTVTPPEVINDFVEQNDYLFIGLKQQKAKLIDWRDPHQPQTVRQMVFGQNSQVKSVFYHNATGRLIAGISEDGYPNVAISEPVDFSLTSNMVESLKTNIAFDYADIITLKADMQNRLHVLYSYKKYAVFDMTDFSSLISIANFTIVREGYHIELGNPKLYLSTGFSGIQIYNGDPINPALNENDGGASSRALGVTATQVMTADYDYGASLFDTTLTLQSLIDTPTKCDTYGVVGDGDSFFVAAACDGVLVFNVSDPFNPRIVGQSTTAGARGVALDTVNKFFYTASFANGLEKSDYRNISNIFSVDNYKRSNGNSALRVSLNNNDACVADINYGLYIVNTANLTNAVPGEYDPNGSTYGMDLDSMRSETYMAVNNQGIITVDHSDQNNITVVSICDTPGSARDVKKRGDILYEADYLNGINLFDYRNPTQCNNITNFASSERVYELALSPDNSKLYAACGQAGPQKWDLTRLQFSGIAPNTETTLYLEVWGTNANREWIAANMIFEVGPRPTSLPFTSSSTRSSSATTNVANTVVTPTPVNTQTASSNTISPQQTTPKIGTEKSTLSDSISAFSSTNTLKTSSSPSSNTILSPQQTTRKIGTEKSTLSDSISAFSSTNTRKVSSETTNKMSTQTNLNDFSTDQSIHNQAIKNIHIITSVDLVGEVGDVFIPIGSEHLSVSGVDAKEIYYRIMTEGYGFYLSEVGQKSKFVASVTQEQINKGWVSIEVEGEAECKEFNIDLFARGSGSAEGYGEQLKLAGGVACANTAKRAMDGFNWMKAGCLISAVGLFAHQVARTNPTPTQALSSGYTSGI